MDAPYYPSASPTYNGNSKEFPSQTAPGWRKVLYERQPFEDNFVDSAQFMKELRKNENVHAYKYSEVMSATFQLIQQVSLIVMFCKVFYNILQKKWGATTLISIDVFILLLSWVFYVYKCFSEDSKKTQENDHGIVLLKTQVNRIFSFCCQFGQSLIALMSFLILLAPVVTTLSASYSDDTIIAYSIVAMVLNVILADYRYLSGVETDFRPNSSTNSAFFAVTMMASRIHNSLEAGAVMTFGAIVFTFSPVARNYSNRFSRAHEGKLTMCSFLVSMWILRSVKPLFVLYTIGLGVVTFVLPFFFVTLHKAKSQISGPWDEAKPQNSAAAAEWANAI